MGSSPQHQGHLAAEPVCSKPAATTMHAHPAFPSPSPPNQGTPLASKISVLPPAAQASQQHTSQSVYAYVERCTGHAPKVHCCSWPGGVPNCHELVAARRVPARASAANTPPTLPPLLCAPSAAFCLPQPVPLTDAELRHAVPWRWRLCRCRRAPGMMPPAPRSP